MIHGLLFTTAGLGVDRYISYITVYGQTRDAEYQAARVAMSSTQYRLKCSLVRI